MNRFPQILLIASTLVGSWLGMQAVHESGHVLGAWVTGGRVGRVFLPPLSFSRTDLAENPNPLAVAWAGPLVGIAVPLVLWASAAAFRLRAAFLFRFFAGFCLIVNGVYIGAGSFDRVGDCGVMLAHGASAWQLWLFGAVAAPAGLGLWHRQGTEFGFGPAKGRVEPGVAYGSLAGSCALLIVCLVVGGR